MDENTNEKEQFRNSLEGKKYRHIAYLILTIFFICLVSVFILFKFQEIGEAISWAIDSLRSVLLGLGFAYILNPMDNSIRLWMVKHAGKKSNPQRAVRIARVHGVAISSIAGAGVIIALIMLIIPSVIESLSSINFSSLLNKILVWVNSFSDQDGPFAMLMTKLVEALQNWFSSDISSYISSISNVIINTGYQIILYVFDFIIAFIVAVYALLEKENFERNSKKMLYAVLKTKHANKVLDICRHGNYVFGRFVSGKLLDSLIIGVLCFILMSIFQLPYALLISVFVGFTNFIPFIGPFIGAIPSAIIIFLVSPQKGLIFIILCLVLQQLDGNVIGPWILGDRTGASPFWIICSLSIFRALFGLLGSGMSIVGMIIGVPLFVTIDYFIKSSVDKRINEKNLNHSEIDFKDVAYYDLEQKIFVPVQAEEERETLLQRSKDAFKKIKKIFPKKKEKK